MWEFVFNAAPVAGVFFAILLTFFLVLKFLEHRRYKKLKAEYEAKQKSGDNFDRFIINH